MPGKKARLGSGGTPRKAARSSQRTPQAGQTAAPSAVTAVVAAAAEEESRLRQRNRLTLEDDKPAAERCLEQLVFGDVEDDEDALLRRLRGSRVRAGGLARGAGTRCRRVRGGRRGPGGGAWGTCGGGRSGGRARRSRAPRGTAALPASGAGPRAGEGGDAVFLRPVGAAALGIQQALHCRLHLPEGCLQTGVGHLRVLMPPLLEPPGWPLAHLSRFHFVGGTSGVGRRRKAAS